MVERVASLLLVLMEKTMIGDGSGSGDSCGCLNPYSNGIYSMRRGEGNELANRAMS